MTVERQMIDLTKTDYIDEVNKVLECFNTYIYRKKIMVWSEDLHCEIPIILNQDVTMFFDAEGFTIRVGGDHNETLRMHEPVTMIEVEPANVFFHMAIRFYNENSVVSLIVTRNKYIHVDK